MQACNSGVAETGLAARLPRECLDCHITTPGLVVNATAPLPMAVLLLARTEIKPSAWFDRCIVTYSPMISPVTERRSAIVSLLSDVLR